jgi:hypothetical protein
MNPTPVDPDRPLVLDMEREARECAHAYGNGWAVRYVDGKRCVVACDVDRYFIRYGYQIDAGFMHRREFFHRLATRRTIVTLTPGDVTWRDNGQV